MLESEICHQASATGVFVCTVCESDNLLKEFVLDIGDRSKLFRFTEFFVDELERKSELKILVHEYLKALRLTPTQIDGIVNFYCEIRKQAASSLSDGTGRRPHFSLRTLCRALHQAAKNEHRNVPRSLYEAFCLSFLTQLDRSSHPAVDRLVCKYVIGDANCKAMLKMKLPEPEGGRYLKFEGYWISRGSVEPVTPEEYVLTSSVRANLRDLSRAVSAGYLTINISYSLRLGCRHRIVYLQTLPSADPR